MRMFPVCPLLHPYILKFVRVMFLWRYIVLFSLTEYRGLCPAKRGSVARISIFLLLKQQTCNAMCTAGWLLENLPTLPMCESVFYNFQKEF